MATHSSSYPENCMNNGAWWATVLGVTKESDTTEQKNTYSHTTYT